MNEKLHKERPQLPKIKIPEPPKESLKAHYGVINVTQYISLSDVLTKTKSVSVNNSVSMEMINIGSDYGQNFGFILYRTKIPKIKELILKSILNLMKCLFFYI